MNKIIKTIALFSILITSAGIAHSSQEVHQFAICLTDSLNGKERKDLAKWIFFGMSSHSMIKPYSKVSESDTDNMNKYIGALITRLMTKDCTSQAKSAEKVLGSAAFEQAFKVVGEVAMQELMTEPSVSQSLGAFERYLDQDKFNEAFQ